jgi:hypothetical protein
MTCGFKSHLPHQKEKDALGVFFFLVHWGAQSLRKGPVCVGCFPQKYLADIFELMHEWYFARCGERPAF